MTQIILSLQVELLDYEASLRRFSLETPDIVFLQRVKAAMLQLDCVWSNKAKDRDEASLVAVWLF